MRQALSARRWYSVVILAGSFCLHGALEADPAPPEVRLEGGAERVGKYEKVEFLIRCELDCRNPFDPDEVEVSLVLRTPGGGAIDLPAFFCQDYERRVLERDGRRVDWHYPSGPPVWKARFAPWELGRYRCAARVRSRAGEKTSGAVSFECLPSARRGFLRVSPGDPRFFEFSEGEAFFAIGQNLAFIGPGQYVSPAKAEEIFRRLAENGANYARIWTCCSDWALAIESRKSAWGRSWGPKPPIVPMPGEGEEGAGAKCLQLDGGDGAALSADPSFPVGLRPGFDYTLSGRIRAEGTASVRLEVNGAGIGEPIAPESEGAWSGFQREFKAAADGWWLRSLRFRAAGGGKLWLADLSLREVGGGSELLWEADVNRPVLGIYNPVDCFLLDRIIDAAEANGIHLQLCLLARDLYMASLGANESPAYERAISQAKKLLRYAVARWGYSTSVAVWEYWNEMNPNLPAGRFYAEVGSYLEQIDPYKHLRAASAWGPAPADWKHEELDLADLHWYLRPNWSELWKDAAAAVADRAGMLRRAAPARPALLSEFGLADERWGLSPLMKEDRELLHFHDALWSSALSGLSGTAMFWWWERLDQQDAYRHYKPLAEFLEGIPFTRGRLRPISARVSEARVRMIGLEGEGGAYFWLSDERASWHRVVVDKEEPAEVRGASVELEDLPAGEYRVEWWDTSAGKAAAPEARPAPGGRLRLQAPPFRRDIACKAILNH